MILGDEKLFGLISKVQPSRTFTRYVLILNQALRPLRIAAHGAEQGLSRHITRIGDLEHAPELLEMVKAQELDGKADVYPHRRTSAVRAVRGWSAEDEREYLRRGKD